MGDIKIFRIREEGVHELEGTSVELEKSLQTLIEDNLESLLGVKFLATEYTTGKTHGGRIDTLGLDENGCPVIIEYKRAVNENVINQGLFYLDWLLDHRGEFELKVLKMLGEKASSEIEWSTPRLLCIAGDFTKYDVHAVQQMNRDIELIRYRRYGEELLLLELVNATSAQSDTGNAKTKGIKMVSDYKTVSDYLAQADTELQDRFEALKAFLLALGDDVQPKTLKYYFAFKRIKNFACVEIHPQKKHILAYVKINPDSITLENGFTQDVRNIGHFGTGDLKITLSSDADLEKAKSLLIRSYEVS
jgi:predicted transport protein